MEKWIIENKDWVVPLSVALLSLIGATLGGWWSGRKRIGIEVLSKNRQEWINELRKNVAELCSNIDNLCLNLKYKPASGDALNPYSTEKYVKEIVMVHDNTNRIKNYLILLLNPNEDSFSKIINPINTIIYNFQYILERQNTIPVNNEMHFQDIED